MVWQSRSHIIFYRNWSWAWRGSKAMEQGGKKSCWSPDASSCWSLQQTHGWRQPLGWIAGLAQVSDEKPEVVHLFVLDVIYKLMDNQKYSTTSKRSATETWLDTTIGHTSIVNPKGFKDHRCAGRWCCKTNQNHVCMCRESSKYLCIKKIRLAERTTTSKLKFWH